MIEPYHKYCMHALSCVIPVGNINIIFIETSIIFIIIFISLSLRQISYSLSGVIPVGDREHKVD